MYHNQEKSDPKPLSYVIASILATIVILAVISLLIYGLIVGSNYNIKKTPVIKKTGYDIVDTCKCKYKVYYEYNVYKGKIYTDTIPVDTILEIIKTP